MQYLSGRIKPTLIGQQKFVLLPGYERGRWRSTQPVIDKETKVLYLTSWLAVKLLSHSAFLLFDPKWRQFQLRDWRSPRCETSAISCQRS